MHVNSKPLSLVLSTLLILTGCQSKSLNSSKYDIGTQQDYEPFFIYPVPDTPTPTILTTVSTQFSYVDGCLLALNIDQKEVGLTSPVFPSGKATFNHKNNTLTLFGTNYEMGEIVTTIGSTTPYANDYMKSVEHSPPEKCIKEYMTVFLSK